MITIYLSRYGMELGPRSLDSREATHRRSSGEIGIKRLLFLRVCPNTHLHHMPISNHSSNGFVSKLNVVVAQRLSLGSMPSARGGGGRAVLSMAWESTEFMTLNQNPSSYA